MGKCRKRLMSIIATVAITSSLFVGSTLTNVSATEVNSNESIYSEVKQSSEVVVYFVKPSGWSTPRAYVYNEGGSVTEYAGKWPGATMKDEGNGLYSYTLPAGVSDALVIFNDGSNQVPGSGQKGFEIKNGVPMKYENGNWEVADTSLRISSISTDLASPQSIDTEIAISANTTGGSGNVLYKFTVSNGTQTQVLSDYSNKSTIKWTPTSIGTYTIKVEVKDGNGDSAELTEKFIINNDPIISDKPIIKNIKPTTETVKPGSKVTFNVNAVGGENVGNGLLFYKFFITEPDGTEKIAQNYSRKNLYTLTANKKGTYKVRVEVENAFNVTVTKETEIVCTNDSIEPTELKINSFTTDKASPQKVGTTLSLTASAQGEGTLQYKFLVYENNKWAIIKDYSQDNFASYKLSSEGEKTLYVDVKDSTGNTVRKNMSFVATKADVEAAPVISSFTTDKASPQVSGTKVTLTANATGSGTLQYKFLVQDDKGNWYKLRDYSTSKSYTWTTGSAGNKTLYVDVKDSNGKVTRKSMSYKVNEKVVAAPVISSFTTDRTSPQVSGTPIVLLAKASGAGTLQYKFIVQDPKGNWTIIQDYSTSNMAVWMNQLAGDNTLYVDVKDSNGKVTREKITFKINKEVSGPVISSFTTDKTSPQASGTPIVLIGKASGTGTLQYKFIVQDSKGNWTKIQDYGTSNMAVWMPNIKGKYNVYLDVKDESGKVVRKEMTYTIQ